MMRRGAHIGLALLLLLGLAIPAASAATLTTEQKFEVLRQNAIMTGYIDRTARLDDWMTREQLAYVLSRLLELPDDSTAKPTYSDVLQTRWSFEEIHAVSAADLMVGVSPHKFNPDGRLSLEQLATALVRAYGSPDGVSSVAGKVSGWARTPVGAALASGILSPRGDYTVSATRRDLVDAVYVVFSKTYFSPVQIRSVEPLTSQTLKVNLLQEWKDNVEPSWFVIRDNSGNTVPVLQATLNADRQSINLTTGQQVDNTRYTLFANGEPWDFLSVRSDRTKPAIVSFERISVRIYAVTYSEPVDPNTATEPANYTLASGLKLMTIQLSQDQLRVTFTTSTQFDERYKLTVKNVKDLAGNVMDTRSDLSFQGSDDVKKPEVESHRINPNATVTVRFSEKVNPQLAVLADRYAIDNGLAVLKAELDIDGLTVKLTTSAQKDATVYRLTVSGITDLAGNMMATKTGLLFEGIASPVPLISLQSMSAINQNTIEVAFNRGISDEDVKNVRVVVALKNLEGLFLTKQHVERKPGTDRIVNVQFRTNLDANPRVFVPGDHYSASVYGVAALDTEHDSNRTKFGGTSFENRAPYVTQVKPVSSNAVKVVFSEPVKNVTANCFTIRSQDGPALTITDDGLNNKEAIATVVELKFNEKLEPGKIYTMKFKEGITDTAGWNGLYIKDNNNDFSISFAGV